MSIVKIPEKLLPNNKCSAPKSSSKIFYSEWDHEKLLNFSPKRGMEGKILLNMMGFSLFACRWRCLKMNYEMQSVNMLGCWLNYVCWTESRKINDVCLWKYFFSLINYSTHPLLHLMNLFYRAVKLWLHMELGADETMTSERTKQNQGI